jgi:hypothetical protein
MKFNITLNARVSLQTVKRRPSNFQNENILQYTNLRKKLGINDRRDFLIPHTACLSVFETASSYKAKKNVLLRQAYLGTIFITIHHTNLKIL